MTLLLHCGGQPASFEQICQVEVPPATASYRPVPHGDVVRLIEREMEDRFHFGKPEQKFGLNQEGNQLFGTLTWDLAVQEDNGLDLSAFRGGGGQVATLDTNALRQYGFTIGLRNSYNKTLSLGVVGGTSCFVCDNLSISGSAFSCIHKHTPNVWESVVTMVIMRVRECAGDYLRGVQFQEHMKEIPLELERGYEIMGLARGRGVLTPTQMNIALDDWRKLNDSKDEEHPFRAYRESAYALYQSFTHGLKHGNVMRKIDQYTGASALFEELQLANVPQQTLDYEDAEIIEH